MITAVVPVAEFMQTYSSLIESVWVVFGLFWVILARFGSLWLVLRRFGSFWVVMARFGSFWVVLADSIV